MTNTVKASQRMAFDAEPDLVLLIDKARGQYGKRTRKAFLNAVMRDIFRLPSPLSAWVEEQRKATAS